MTPENFLNDINQIIYSIDANKTFTAEEVKAIFTNLKKVILSNFNAMDYTLKAEMKDGEIVTHNGTKMKKIDLQKAVAFEVYETKEFTVDIDACLDTVKQFCETTGIAGMMLPPGIRTLSLVPSAEYTELFADVYEDPEDDPNYRADQGNYNQSIFDDDDDEPWTSNIPF